MTVTTVAALVTVDGRRRHHGDLAVLAYHHCVASERDDEPNRQSRFVPVDGVLAAFASAPAISYERLRDDLDRHVEPEQY